MYRVSDANRGHTGGDAGLLAITDRRLVFAAGDGSAEEWAFSRIAQAVVDTAMLGGKLELRLTDGSKHTIAFLFDRSAPAEFARLLEEAGGRTSGMPSPAAGQPHVEVLQRTSRVRALRIEFGRETHTLTYTAGMFRDKLELDGTILSYAYMENAEGFPLTLSDGDGTLPARLKVALNGTGQAILDITLVVDGQVVYSERPD